MRSRVFPASDGTGTELAEQAVSQLMTRQDVCLPRRVGEDKACGNRRITVCPGCAETYRRDAYHLLRAGLVGGKGITPDVAGHPAVFVTCTAPSFGLVHSRPVRQHTCTDKARCRCQPQPCHARA